jgi:hypothetical protein
MDNKEFFKVILDDQFRIVDFKCTFNTEHYDWCEIEGKNFFDIFLKNKSDRELITKTFEAIDRTEDDEISFFSTDVLCKNGSHKYLDCYSLNFEDDGKMVHHIVGVEHYKNHLKDTFNTLFGRKMV